LWDPFQELEQAQKEILRLFDPALSRFGGEDTTLLGGQWAPAIDIHEEKDRIVVTADLPGLKKEDIEVSVQENNLLIKGEKKQEAADTKQGFLRRERFFGSFFRSIALPGTVDANSIQASYKDGVLSLSLPKKEEAKPKQIKIDVK